MVNCYFEDITKQLFIMSEQFKSIEKFNELTLTEFFEVSDELATIGSLNGHIFLRRSHDRVIDALWDKANVKISELGNDHKEELSAVTNKIEILSELLVDVENLYNATEDNAYDCRNRCYKQFLQHNDAIRYQTCINNCPVGQGPKAAVLFKHINYSGAFVPIEYDADNRDLRRNSFNDMTSSIRLKPGWKLLVSEHVNHGGRRFWVTNNIPDLGKTPIGHDSISSLIAFRK